MRLLSIFSQLKGPNISAASMRLCSLSFWLTRGVSLAHCGMNFFFRQAGPPWLFQCWSNVFPLNTHSQLGLLVVCELVFQI